MIGLLEEALRRLESLPAAEQDALAAQIMETLDNDACLGNSLLCDRKYQQAYEIWKSIQPAPDADATKRMSRDDTHERR